MDIALLATGAAGMYCGSCLRDSALAGALLRAGHRVTLVPLYTPLRTERALGDSSPVFFGGLNVWLQYATSIFRRTPRAVDWLFDRPWLLNWAAEFGVHTSPAKLGPFVVSVVQGDQGPQVKELRRLVAFLKEIRPEIVSLPNLLFAGMAPAIRRELGRPIVCELTGEDIFLDALAEPFASQARELIREGAKHVSGFVATSRYYARRMAEYLGFSERMHVVYPGIPRQQIRRELDGRGGRRTKTVGYFARICPEKGLDRLVEAWQLLRQRQEVRLCAAGYLGPAQRKWLAGLQRVASFEYAGEVDLQGKLDFLDSVDVLSVPTAYPEPKGIYILEAMARGVPVVQPAHGAFPELIEQTGGGVLVAPGDAQALAEALAAMLNDAEKRDRLARAGWQSVGERFTDDHMASKMLDVYRGLAHD